MSSQTLTHPKQANKAGRRTSILSQGPAQPLTPASKQDSGQSPGKQKHSPLPTGLRTSGIKAWRSQPSGKQVPHSANQMCLIGRSFPTHNRAQDVGRTARRSRPLMRQVPQPANQARASTWKAEAFPTPDRAQDVRQ